MLFAASYRTLALAAAALVPVLALGCGEDQTAPTSDVGGQAGCAAMGGTGGAAVGASFASDVVPLWDRSCSGFGCHASPRDADSHQAFVDTWVGQHGFLTDEMLLIAAGDPEASFLMHKLDGDHACLSVACKFDGCGLAMPPGATLLPLHERAVFRGWIAAGAKAD